MHVNIHCVKFSEKYITVPVSYVAVGVTPRWTHVPYRYRLRLATAVHPGQQPCSTFHAFEVRFFMLMPPFKYHCSIMRRLHTSSEERSIERR